RVDEREEVVLVDRGLGLGEGGRVRGGELATMRPQVVELGERDYAPEAEVGDLRPLLLVLDERADRVRVLEHVAAVLRRAVRVDRRANGTDQAERVIEERPLEARLGD